MHIITLVAEKGGVGKTTIALELAVAAFQAGLKSAVIDVDPQATASQWNDRREAEYPLLVATHAIRIAQTIAQAREQQIDLVVIDTPPHSGSHVVQAAAASNLVVYPVEPQFFSLETVVKQSQLMPPKGPPSFYVINRAQVQGTEAADAAKFLEEQGFTVCPVYIHLRSAHRHAANAGLSPTELAPSSKAAEEVLALYAYTMQQLNGTKQEKLYG